MTATGAITAAPSARLAAIEDGLRAKGSGRSGGSSFEALLAEATARQSGSVWPMAQRSSATPLGSRSRPPGSLFLVGAGAAPSGSSFSSTGTSAGQAVIDAASTHLGVPYLWGGTDAENGFDCSGLIQDAYRRIGVDMPKWSRHQAKMGAEIDSIENALPGDILTFGEPVDHVGLYVGDGQMLYAPKAGDVVKIGPIYRPIESIRRIVAAGSTGPVPGPSSVNWTPNAPGDMERLYQPLFAAAGERWNVDPALLAAVSQTESGFNKRAVSSAGAQGLMQFMPATAAGMGVDPWDPASAIDGAARYLRQSLDQFGSHELAIASYNAGRGAVSRYGGVPPYSETQRYVEKVLDAWRNRS